jgi:flagellar basal-body rod protein FlgB
MLISDLSSSGSLPVLERMFQFAGQRQRILAHNIANMETPDFRPVDVSPADFQKALAKAVAERRGRTGGEHGELELASTREVSVTPAGLELSPRTHSPSVLYHDRNNRDLERLMQDLAENGMVFRLTADLIRRQHDILRTAISQRV